MAREGDARHADLWLVAAAIGLSAAGDFIALIGLALQANDMHGDGIGVSSVFICLWAPIAVLAGYVGLVALAGGGLLVVTLGARGTLFIAGSVSAAAGVAGLVLLRRRRLPAAVGDHP